MFFFNYINDYKYITCPVYYLFKFEELEFTPVKLNYSRNLYLVVYTSNGHILINVFYFDGYKMMDVMRI